MSIATALRLRRGRGRLHWTDLASYAYLLLGVVLMFGPVLWLGLSSFKTQAGLLEFPPSLLPSSQKEVSVPGYDKPLPLLWPNMIVVIVLALIRGVQTFDEVFVLTGGGPGTATQTMQMLNYRAFGLGHMGEANAIGIVTLIIVAVLCFVLMRAVLRPQGARS